MLYNSFESVVKSFGMTTLTHPLFCNSKVALRFNIGDNGNEVYLNEGKENSTVNPEYVSACLNRAKLIYNSLKNPPNILVIEGYLYENDSVEDFITAATTGTNLPCPQEIKSEIITDDDGDYNHIFLCWEINEFNPDKLFQEIIIADLGSENHLLTSSVYFVCSKNNVVFHLYDDRGADLCAEKVESISRIYYDLNDLILLKTKKK